ncbi:glutathione S-transferase family protein [Emcibacter nanhaiensis]|uniref:Glutathione S-transferase family protein n=1 Tax=Emcibacter nanhaiensis TaxID=1505037 RepID=A0A501PB65_9PROT|nr:glutathione S-transferase family protein [Emcibacter nanhaiensis]TPD57465.1 glutathione S-transferase family protein [Emcibacter nanhaiensis]
MKLYYNPLSTYSQKVLIAFYEKGLTFEPFVIDPRDKSARQSYQKIYPLGKIPLLITEQNRPVPESSIIIEFLDMNYMTGATLLPRDGEMSRQARLKDRMYDLYLNNPVVELLFESQKPRDRQDPCRMIKARETLDIMYEQLNENLCDHSWANGEEFSIADCAAAPALFYGQRVHPFSKYPAIKAYFSRLLGRPSLQKVLGEAEPLVKSFLK